MRRLRRVAGERVERHPADIAVGFKLRPGPAVGGGFEHRDAFAAQGFGLEPRPGRRLAPHGRMRRGDPERVCLHETSRLNFPIKRRVRKVRAEGVQAAVERAHGKAAIRKAARPP
jgi:hypothetical protein